MSRDGRGATPPPPRAPAAPAPMRGAEARIVRRSDELIGRTNELTRLSSLRGNVTLWGPPGVGKSTLVRAAYRDAAIVVDLSLVSVTDLAEALSRSVDGRSVDEIAPWLAATGRTLVLDGLERWGADRARALVDALGPADVVVTAWAPLGVADERCVELRPLDRADATRLFASLCGADAEPVHDLVDSAGGWPLAIELLATLTRSLGAATVRRHLPALLSSSPVSHSIEAAIATLGDVERAVLLALAIAPDELPMDAVTELSRSTTAQTMTAVAALVDRGLARFRDGEASVLDAVRDTAIANASPSERVTAEDAHTAWATTLLADHPRGHGGVDSTAAFRLLKRRRAHLEVAFARAAVTSPDTAARLALDLDPLYVLEGATDAHLARLERALDATVDRVLRAEVAVRLGRVAGLQGANSVALAVVAPFVAPLPAETLARLCAVVSHARVNLGDTDGGERAAAQMAEHAQAVASPAERDRLLAFANQFLAVCASLRGDALAASRHYDVAMTLARRRGATRMLALALANASDVPGLPADEREQRIREAHALFVDVGDRLHVAMMDLRLVRLAPAREREAKLRELAARAEEVAEHTVRAAAWLDLCEIAWTNGDRAGAERALASARLALARTDDAEEHARATRVAAAVRGEAAARSLRVRRDGTSVILGDQEIDLANRRALPRLMLALVRDATTPGGRGLDVLEMFAAGWPGERASVASLSARVHVAVRTLRGLGIESVIVTRQGRYSLSADVAVSWLD